MPFQGIHEPRRRASSAFIPAAPLPQVQRNNVFQAQRLIKASVSQQPTTTRRQILITAWSLSAAALLSARSEASPVETDSVFMDLSVAGRPAGRIVIGLYGQEAPVSVDTFVKLANGNLRNRAGKTAGFKYSQAAKVVPGKRVQLGRVKQIDAVNQQPGMPQRQTIGVEVPENRDNNLLHHDASGLVSVRRGGSFEFSVLLGPDEAMDEENLVVGRVTDGMEVVERLGRVPTNKKTIRDGYRSVGKVIGDARAKVDLEDKVSMCSKDYPRNLRALEITRIDH